jgi:hypothetical protein
MLHNLVLNHEGEKMNKFKSFTIILITLSSLSVFSQSEFERGFDLGRRITLGRLLIVKGSEKVNRNARIDAYNKLEDKCSDGTIMQRQCLDGLVDRNGDLQYVCSGICINK